MSNTVIVSARVRPLSLMISLALLCTALVMGLANPPVAYAEEQFSITGRGYGHGIGMSQWGAKGYAENGYTYRQILAHYYTDTTVATAPTKSVCVALDDGKEARSEWRLRAGYVGERLTVNGVQAPADVTYAFKPSGTAVAVYTVDQSNSSTLILWRTFTAPVTLASQCVTTQERTYEENDSAISCRGTWVRYESAGWSGGAYRYSYTAGSSATLAFSGTSFTMVGAKGPAYGKMSVSIDGKAPVQVDTYATTATGSTVVYEVSGLTAGNHTAVVTVLGEKNTESSGTTIILDAFEVDSTVSNEPSLVQVLSASGPSNMGYVRYRGVLNLAVADGGLELTNTLNIEDYLYGVVPRESPSSWHAEALKAQAVAARSYAYTETAATLHCTTWSQVYNGHSRTTSDRTAVTMHEATTTNSAVDATRSQVVKYGTTIARTYFFSSSGGHTANSEDVWSAAEPYLRGVPDPYEAGAAPATGWPWARSWGEPITYTGSALATKLGYGSAVTAARCDAAASGHVKTVQMTLANGSNVSMTGDRFRSKLGLRSTVYQVAGTTLVETGRVEDSNGRFSWSGSWVSAKSSAFSGGTYRYSLQAGSTATLKTTATSVALVGSYGPSYGKAEVWIDGVKAGTIDAYAPQYAHSKVLFSRAGLSSAMHTVVVKALGMKNVQSTGTVFVFDALDFTGIAVDPRPTPPLETGRVEDSSSRVSYSVRGWMAQSSTAFSGGSYRYSLASGATATVKVTATSVGVVGSYGPSYGKAEVWIDGVKAGTIDAYAPQYAHSKVLLSKTGLSASAHTVVVKALGTKNTKSTGTVFIFDAFDCSGAPADLQPGVVPETGRVEDSSSRFSYTGSWVSVKSAAFSGGSYRYSLKTGSTAIITMTATSVALVGSYGPSYGQAEVFVDGVSAGVVDAYAETYAHNRVLFSKTGLATGTHTVTVKMLGTKNMKSTGTVFIFDALDFSGVPVDSPPGETGRFEDDSDRVTYTGTWLSGGPSSAFSGGTYRYSSWSGRSATIQTTATSVAIVGSYGPTYGEADVWIDGMKAGTIDAYAPQYAHNTVLFSKSDLESGTHTVELRILGTQSENSSGATFIFDAFDFCGLPVDAPPTAPASVDATTQTADSEPQSSSAGESPEGPDADEIALNLESSSTVESTTTAAAEPEGVTGP